MFLNSFFTPTPPIEKSHSKTKFRFYQSILFSYFNSQIITISMTNNYNKDGMLKKAVPEDFELSDDEPTTINLDKEQTVSSNLFITFDCPLCQGK